jgi:anti-sigma factor RsiW
MPTLLFDDDTNPLDDTELEALSEYLEGRMSDDDEQDFETRLATDHAFRGRVRPIVRKYFAQELSAIDVEIGRRLAERGLIRPPKIEQLEPRTERPRRRASRRRRPERQPGQES